MFGIIAHVIHHMDENGLAIAECGMGMIPISEAAVILGYKDVLKAVVCTDCTYEVAKKYAVAE